MGSEKALPLSYPLYPSPPLLERRWMLELSGTCSPVMDLDLVDQNKKDYSESQRFSFLFDEG